jgi:hypothetical protein
MPSIVWGRHPQEAYEHPYEYAAQEQFLREARRLLDELRDRLNMSQLRYHRDEHSLEKATWMLAHDLVDALSEIGALVEAKRHRVAARHFRDCLETIDLLAVLHSGTAKATSALLAWYANETIPHRESRMYLESVSGPAAAADRRAYFDQLSKFTHRTYRALLHSYSLGRDDLLVHDSHSQSGTLVLPHVIAAYLAVLADLVTQAAATLVQSGALSEPEVMHAWALALESQTVPRRFAVGPGGAP